MYAGEFHYQPENANDTTAQWFLSQLIQSDEILDVDVVGDEETTPFLSLLDGVKGIKLSSQIRGLNQPNLIATIQVLIPLDVLETNMVSGGVDIHNPVDVDMVIEFVQAEGRVNGQVYAFFAHSFDGGFLVPGRQTVNSGMFNDVNLTQGVLPLLDLLPLETIDIDVAATVRIGQGGYQLPWLKLSQTNVPFTLKIA